ncbi:molecular chaperone DnaJ [Acinetobacter tianfuensis]|uniref:Molecular chaperone DnaJ n=1 Tax=Acinetobacter tianfuensis TaxID=2419603 RepID=A0A3A8EMB1_9GAMM|nr:molecular chaperone DnaJ [Acinetobacter tianfuensis]RKG34626.1 molecular chaperone DnaJ [Acinetobacter tianfuensis]
MSFDLKISLLPASAKDGLSAQHKKLNQLIECIEQQKQNLQLWKNAQTDIQSYIQFKLIPIYAQLYLIWFQQLEQLWTHLQQQSFSKADMQSIDYKLYKLAQTLKKSKNLNQPQQVLVGEVTAFYLQHYAHQRKKAKSAAFSQPQAADDLTQERIEPEDKTQTEYEEWDSEQFQAQKAAHQRKRLQQKREQAQKQAEQSLKTVYLKITAAIHPDRELDETKKAEKNELLQVVNQAYQQQDLFYLLKLQLQLDTNKGKTPKALTDEHIKFYKMALESQSQNLASQINDITDTLHWSENPKPKNMQVKDVYQVIDTEAAALKEQLKWEQERFNYMRKVSGLEMLLERGIL